MAILIQFFFFLKKKYLQKKYKSFSEFNVSKLPVFTSQILDLWFLAPAHILPFLISRFVDFTFKTDHFLNCKKYSTYAEISILKLVEVNVLPLFGISLAKWIWHPCSIGISDKYLSKIYSLCFTIGGRFQSIIALAHVNYYIKKSNAMSNPKPQKKEFSSQETVIA